MDYSRALCLGADQKTHGLWERDWAKSLTGPCKIFQDPPGSLKIFQRSSKMCNFQGSLRDPAKMFKRIL